MTQLTAEQLESLLVIDKHDLDNAVAQQPDLYYRVATEAAGARDAVEAAKAELDRVAAEKALQLRQEAETKNAKITEGRISEQVTIDSGYRTAIEVLQELRASSAKWDSLREAFLQRSQMLKIMTDQYVAGYWSTSAVRSGAAGHKEGKATEGRSALAAGRNSIKKR